MGWLDVSWLDGLSPNRSAKEVHLQSLSLTIVAKMIRRYGGVVDAALPSRGVAIVMKTHCYGFVFKTICSTTKRSK